LIKLVSGVQQCAGGRNNTESASLQRARYDDGAGGRVVKVGHMTHELRTFMTFQGGAATAALELYRDVFDDFELDQIEHYGPSDAGREGTVKVARFRLAGGHFSCADSPVRHEWGFTPAVSLWIDCDDNTELQRLFDQLRVDGQVFMPLDDYGFSTRFGWVGDRFGVTWQLNLP
jgi:predicted 3-demethylubiquinone-9 3-methyltransferase (glyoxalase superfamily)